MLEYVCDICGRKLPADGEGRYIVRIQVFAAPQTRPIEPADLEIDIDAEIRKVLKQLEAEHADKIEDGVYRLFSFDLCPACQKKYLKDPLCLSLRTKP